MKIEISIEKNGKDKGEEKEKPELMDEKKKAIASKLRKNMMLTRTERSLLGDYLLEDED